jgi:hypothetical protein
MFDPTAPIEPATRLDRNQTAAALTARGFKMAHSTLATLASRGGGPPFTKFGPHVAYQWGDALTWAQRRTSAPVILASQLANGPKERSSDQETNKAGSGRHAHAAA